MEIICLAKSLGFQPLPKVINFFIWARSIIKFFLESSVTFTFLTGTSWAKWILLVRTDGIQQGNFPCMLIGCQKKLITSQFLRFWYQGCIQLYVTLLNLQCSSQDVTKYAAACECMHRNGNRSASRWSRAKLEIGFISRHSGHWNIGKISSFSLNNRSWRWSHILFPDFLLKINKSPFSSQFLKEDFIIQVW